MDEGDQCTGFLPLYTCPLRNICPNTSICAASYSGSRVRYGSSQSPHTPYLLNESRCLSTVLSAKFRAFLRSLMGVSAFRASASMDCNTLSSMGRPWQSHPGT